MRIALFSDIHGNFTGLQAVLDAIPALGGADILVAAGDHIAGESGTDDVLELLQEHQVHMVKGDSDTEEKLIQLEREATVNPGSTRSPAWYYREMHQWLEAHLSPAGRDLLDSLPHSLTIEAAPNRCLYVCHASPRSLGDRVCSSSCDVATVREAFASVQADVIAFGHAHESFIRLLDGHTLINVASVGFRRDGLSKLTLLTFTEEHWLIAQHAIPFDVNVERERTLRRGVPYYP